MRIENNNVRALYEKAKLTAKQDGKVSGATPDNAGKTDRVSFSAEAAQKAPVSRMAQVAAAEIETQVASQGRLAQLTSQVNAGIYHVPTDKLVGAIIDVFG